MRFSRLPNRTVLLCAALVLLGVASGSDSAAKPPPACHEIEVTYEGRDYLYTKHGIQYYRWKYRVTGDSCITRALSHWTIQFCGEWLSAVSGVSTRSVDPSDLDNGYTTVYTYEIGYDPITELTGLKWEHVGGNELDSPGEYDRFSFVCPGTLTSESPLGWVSKGGRLFDGGAVLGPGCFPPVSTEQVTWGRIKSLVR